MFRYLLPLLILNVWCIAAQVKDTTLLRLEHNLKVVSTDSAKIDAYLQLGDYQLRRDFNKVTEYVNDAEHILNAATPYKNLVHKAWMAQLRGVVSRRRSNYSKSLSYYIKARKILEVVGDSLRLSSNYHNIGVVYKYQKEYEKAISNLRQAIKINEKINSSRRLGNNYNMLAVVYMAMKANDSALYYYGKAKDYYEIDNYKEGVFQIVANKALILRAEEEYEEALVLQLEYLDYVISINKKQAIGNINHNIAGTYLEMGDFKQALVYVNKAIRFGKQENMKRRVAVSYKRRSFIYNKMGDYKKALDDYRYYSKSYDSIYDISKAKELREVELNYNFEQQKLIDSIQFAEENKRITVIAENQALKKKLYLVLFIVTLILSAIIAYYGIRYFKKRSEQSRVIQEQLSERLKLSAKENNQRVTTLKTEIDGLSDQIDFKKQEITELMTESLKHIKTKERLVDDLKKVASKDDNISIKGIIADLKSGAIEDSRMLMIKNHLDELNFEFFKTIKEKHVDLTKTDIEICSYLRLSLGRKEIAALRNTSIEAVRKTRYRLRKKMNLSEDDDLETYIKSL